LDDFHFDAAIVIIPALVETRPRHGHVVFCATTTVMDSSTPFAS
jgi:hypothetical protein